MFNFTGLFPLTADCTVYNSAAMLDMMQVFSTERMMALSTRREKPLCKFCLLHRLHIVLPQLMKPFFISLRLLFWFDIATDDICTSDLSWTKLASTTLLTHSNDKVGLLIAFSRCCGSGTQSISFLFVLHWLQHRH